MKTLIKIAAGALIMTIITTSAHAYVWQKCGSTNARWAYPHVTFRASAAAFQPGVGLSVGLSDAINNWNQSPSSMTYGLQWGDSQTSSGNGENEIWFSPSISPPAVTIVWTNFLCQIIETDVIFKSTVTYSASTSKTALTPYGGSARPMQTTAMHEFGHAQGLNHTADTYSIMGQDWDHIHCNGSSAHAYAGEDAVTGSVNVYGLGSNARNELGLAHWRYTGSTSDGYSKHERTRIFSSSGAVLDQVNNSAPEPTYRVSSGQWVKPEFTLENMGKTYSHTNVKVSYYLSTNDFISAGDTYLGSRTFTVNRNMAYTTFSQSVRIPTGLTSGRNYWVGAIIDSDNKVSERLESDNRSYIGIRIN